MDGNQHARYPSCFEALSDVENCRNQRPISPIVDTQIITGLSTLMCHLFIGAVIVFFSVVIPSVMPFRARI